MRVLAAHVMYDVPSFMSNNSVKTLQAIGIFTALPTAQLHFATFIVKQMVT